MKKTSKDFDCIEMKRNIQEKIFEETKGMARSQYEEHMRGLIQHSRFAAFLTRPAATTLSEER